MALLVLFSTLSLTVMSHYCGDLLVDSSLFGSVKTCGMEVQQKLPSRDCNITKKACCSDEQLLIDGQDNLKNSSDSFEIEQQLFLVSLVYSYIHLFNESQVDVNLYRDYSPPPLIRNIQVLDQTFLI